MRRPRPSDKYLQWCQSSGLPTPSGSELLAYDRGYRDAVGMPAALTAENGAKAALSGEFHESIEVPDPEDDDSTLIESVPVSWTTIKAIYAAAVEHFNRPDAD